MAGGVDWRTDDTNAPIVCKSIVLIEWLLAADPILTGRHARRGASDEYAH